jgi:hypothetical protein
MIAPPIKLRMVKTIHTLAWALFASAILIIPVAAWSRAWQPTLMLVLLVFAECLTVLASGMKCPLTPIAARYTEDRSDNFDIYLPVWLARYNKLIFGTLYVLGCIFAAALWLARR